MAVRHVGGWKPGDRNTFASDYSVCVPSSASVWSGSRSRRAGAPPSPARGRGRRPSRAVSRGPRGRAGSPPPARRRRRGRSGRGAIPVVRVEESVKERTCHGYTIHNAAILWLYVGVKVSIKSGASDSRSCGRSIRRDESGTIGHARLQILYSIASASSSSLTFRYA